MAIYMLVMPKIPSDTSLSKRSNVEVREHYGIQNFTHSINLAELASPELK